MVFQCPKCGFQGNPAKWLHRTRSVFKLKSLSAAAKFPVYICPYCGTEMKSSKIYRLAK